MFCDENCNRYETCEIISKMEKLRYKILRFRNNVQTKLFQSVEEMKEKRKEEQMKLLKQRLELRRKQNSCLQRRRFSQYLGYSCFKRKAPIKENGNTEPNQTQTLDSYF